MKTIHNDTNVIFLHSEIRVCVNRNYRVPHDLAVNLLPHVLMSSNWPSWFVFVNKFLPGSVHSHPPQNVASLLSAVKGSRTLSHLPKVVTGKLAFFLETGREFWHKINFRSLAGVRTPISLLYCLIHCVQSEALLWRFPWLLVNMNF